MTDLGALGLVGTGFEVSASEVSGLNGTVGSTADDEAVTTGLPVQQLEPETSMNYELGMRVYGDRVNTDLAVFFNEIKNNIVKQSLILPPGAVGQRLGSETITEQLSNGVVFVNVATTPVLVRANFGKDQIWGIEHTFDLRINTDWSFGSILTYVHTQAKNGDARARWLVQSSLRACGPKLLDRALHARGLSAVAAFEHRPGRPPHRSAPHAGQHRIVSLQTARPRAGLWIVARTECSGPPTIF